ncbi:isopentenyldiphosphate isomerase [Galbibacter orientalis DSM 19592]|uniref:Isopentenyldiphosphate isomerase n=2 Tax=Galbibacter TaxID=379068 RepID=I3C901_9FLAO|nr:NUDIX domain-containing protein [Galbibacter orientalis]EIJ40094.1 isopentenyldiphosphate isomerase [Galbibacter orientalis DSM 19592]
MDELVDILDSEGNATGKVLLKSEAHKKGLFHPTAHVWLYTQEGKVLIQKRVADKKTFPNKWDVSVAGHISAGETAEVSAVREVQEEIGLTISEKDLEKIGVHRSSVVHSKDVIDCEFHHIFLVELKQPLETLSLQESEVAEIKLTPINVYLAALKNHTLMKDYVPLEPDYLDLVFSAIRRKII